MSVSATPRFVTIDGLRGIAALSVVFYHFYEPVRDKLVAYVPGVLDAIMRNGHLGVDIFFVISGFVIAFSIREGDITPKYLVRFAARRSVRLDPPYWCAIALEILILYVGIRLMPGVTSKAIPSWETIVAHLFYAQGFLQHEPILAIFWTLTYEIQFYLFIVVLAMAWQALRPRLGIAAINPIRYGTLGAVFVLSLLVRFTSLETIPGLALDRWFQFFLGALVWWVLSRRATPAALALAWVAVIGVVLATGSSANQLVAVAVSAFIFTVGRLGKLETILGASPLQFLGKISYSVYLFHLPVGAVAMTLGERAFGTPSSALVALALLSTTVLASVIAGAVGWKLLEEPSMSLSRRIRLPRRLETPQPASLPRGVPALSASAAPDAPTAWPVTRSTMAAEGSQAV